MHSLIIEWQIENALLWSCLCRRNLTNRLESVTFFSQQISQLHFPIKVFPVDKVELQKGAKCCNVFQMVLQTSLKDRFIFSHCDFKMFQHFSSSIHLHPIMSRCIISLNFQFQLQYSFNIQQNQFSINLLRYWCSSIKSWFKESEFFPTKIILRFLQPWSFIAGYSVWQGLAGFQWPQYNPSALS